MTSRPDIPGVEALQPTGKERPVEPEIKQLTGEWGPAVMAVLSSFAHGLSTRPKPEEELTGSYVNIGLEGKEPRTVSYIDLGLDLEEEDLPPEKVSGEMENRRYTALGEIIRSQNYGDGATMDANTLALVRFYEDVFRAEQGSILYFGAKGQNYLEKPVPPNWYSGVPTGKTERVQVTVGKGKNKKKRWVMRKVMLKAMAEQEKNDWHNANRRAIPIPDSEKHLPKKYKEAGYPFTATPVLPNVSGNGEKKSLFDVILERLNQEVVCPGTGTLEGSRHLGGEKMKLYDAIKKMADAYDIPWAIALGLAANESGYDQNAVSDANAYGIFQIQPGAYKDAKKYADQHPEYSSKVRKGEILGFKEEFHGVTEWKNRLVQAEMFCAYFRLIQEQMGEDMDKLDMRLKSLDPTYISGTLSLISTITSYNAGPTRVKRCIRRFLELSDEEIKTMIGNGPYGIDVWQAVLANSFGRVIKLDKKGEEVTEAVGPHVFTYASKVLAMGSLIIEEENILEVLAERGQEHYVERWEKEEQERLAREVRERLAAEESAAAEVAKAEKEAAKHTSKWPFKISQWLSVVAGLATGVQVARDVKTNGVGRREVLKGAAATLGMGVPLVRTVGDAVSDIEEPPEEEEPVPEKPKDVNHERLVAEGKKRVDALYEELRERKSYGRTTVETNRLKNHLTLARVLALKPFILRVFGKGWEHLLKPNGNTLPAVPREFITGESGSQMENLRRMLESGEAIPMEANNPDLPYFCQQVGNGTGIANNPDSMYMHRDFLPILNALVDLVNYQIDAFNADPSAYGMTDETFPAIAHIDGVKISGAFRHLNDHHAGSTESFSDHWTVMALDMISQGVSAGAGVVRFKENQYLKSDKSQVLFAAGEFLPAQGEGPRLRNIIVRMIEHALWILEDTLKKTGPAKIMPRYEGERPPYYSNWHVTLVPVLPPEPQSEKQPAQTRSE